MCFSDCFDILLVFIWRIYLDILIYNLFQFQKLVKVGSYSYVFFRFSNAKIWKPLKFLKFSKFEIWSYGINSWHFFVLMLICLSYLWISWWEKFNFEALCIQILFRFECIEIEKEKFTFTKLNFVAAARRALGDNLW